MKALNRSTLKITAALGLAGLFTLSVAQAADITWVANGIFADNTVLALAGPAANEVYGVDFGGSGNQTTANGYAFADYGNGNMTIGGGTSDYGGFLNGDTTGDPAFDQILTYGIYGNTMSGTLNNLTVGTSYTVMALLDDTRGAHPQDSTFDVTDGVTTSPSQVFVFSGGINNGTNAIGGYVMGTFTATATTQTFTINISYGDQYDAILLETAPPPVVPLPVLITNTLPTSAAAGIGGQAVFTASFSTSPPANLQWENIANGTTNNVNAANATVVTVTNDGVVSSTLTFVNLQATNAGSYQLEAVNATNSLGVAYSTPAVLTVHSLIFWLQTGMFTSDSVLALAGTPANEVYGVDFGAGDQTTGVGYTFTDAYSGQVPTTTEFGTVSGNMSMAGNISEYDDYFTQLSISTGDTALDDVLTCGVYGAGGSGTSPMNGTLLNLTVGQEYTVLVLLDDTRTGPWGDFAGSVQAPESVFYGSDGLSVSPYQSFVFPDATNELGATEIGGYALGVFTANSTNEPLSIVTENVNGKFLDSQYNAILVEKTSMAPPALPIYLNANTMPTPASNPLTSVIEGSNIVFTAAFANYPEPLNLQWQVISTNGVTNNINAGVVTVTNLGIVSSTLTVSNVQLAVAGSSYQLEAVDATDSLDAASSTPVPLTVIPLTVVPTNNFAFVSEGTFTNDLVLALAGTPANEVYGVNFGAYNGAETTTNGYTFANYTFGNMSLYNDGSLGQSSQNEITYGNGNNDGDPTSTGDSALDAMLNSGSYGDAGIVGTLNNLTLGQTYYVISLLALTGWNPGSTMALSDGVVTTPYQDCAFPGGTAESGAEGGYVLVSFTATATTQTLTSLINYNGSYNSQYNCILVETAAVVVVPPILATPYYSAGNLILTGTGGTPNAPYNLLTTTNLTPPVVWTTNTAGTFDGSGDFSNSIPVNASTPTRFFQVQVP